MNFRRARIASCCRGLGPLASRPLTSAECSDMVPQTVACPKCNFECRNADYCEPNLIIPLPCYLPSSRSNRFVQVCQCQVGACQVEQALHHHCTARLYHNLLCERRHTVCSSPHCVA